MQSGFHADKWNLISAWDSKCMATYIHRIHRTLYMQIPNMFT